MLTRIYRNEKTNKRVLVNFNNLSTSFYSFLFSILLLKPVKFTNHGELIDPIIKLENQSFTINNEFTELIQNNYGNWLVITFLTNRLCDEKCEQKVYWIKQIHTAQGKEMSRLKEF